MKNKYVFGVVTPVDTDGGYAIHGIFADLQSAKDTVKQYRYMSYEIRKYTIGACLWDNPTCFETIVKHRSKV